MNEVALRDIVACLGLDHQARPATGAAKCEAGIAVQLNDQ